MNDLMHVLVLMGGPDAERAVSIQSGLAIAEALSAHSNLKVTQQVIDLVNFEELSKMPGDVIFPALHGPWGEGGGLQDLLEELGRPYVGSGPQAARLAMDKLASKKTAAAAGFQTPAAVSIGTDEQVNVDVPLVIKPVSEGSSIDVLICHDTDTVRDAVLSVQNKNRPYMAESYVQGREITVGIVNGRVLPLIEIIPVANTYDYDAKYVRDDTNYVIDPDLPIEVMRECRRCAMEVFNRLGCRDLARVDFMVDQKCGWFLEINTMPGFTDHSLVPKAAAAAGSTMSDLCKELVEAAWTRGQQISSKQGQRA